MVNNHEPMLLRTAAAARPPMAQQFLQHTADGGRRAQALIRQLLTVARVESHRDVPRGRPVVRKGRAIGRAAPQRHPLQAKQLQQRAAAAMDASQASGRRKVATLSEVNETCGRP
jgi:signal transduction histidine kinase